jgi:hypothetical protein
LLKKHGEDSHKCPLPQRFVGHQGQIVVEANPEIALEVAALVLGELFRQTDPFKVACGLDFQKFDPDPQVVGRRASESRQCFQTFLFASTIHEMARTLRHEEHHTNG